jgi:hypothetical protein
MSKLTAPLYVSKRAARSLWLEHRVYPDRIEIETLCFGTMRVALTDIQNVTVRGPLSVLDLEAVVCGETGLLEMLRCPNLDLADLHEHVAIERRSGFWRRFRIATDAPLAFVQAVLRARWAALAAAGA